MQTSNSMSDRLRVLTEWIPRAAFHPDVLVHRPQVLKLVVGQYNMVLANQGYELIVGRPGSVPRTTGARDFSKRFLSR